MMSKLLLSTALVVAGATAGMAQGFNGASLGINYSDFPDVDEFGGVNYFGSAEFGITPQFAVALDVSFYDFEFGDADVSNYTLHAIYNLDSATSFGLFFGQDQVDELSVDNFGFEAAYDFGVGDIQGYIGAGDDGSDSVTYIGASTRYGLGNGISAIASFDTVSFDDTDSSATAFELGAEYALPSGPRFSASFGNLGFDDGIVDADESYFKIGASIDFGTNGGVTFDRKGFFETVQFSSL